MEKAPHRGNRKHLPVEAFTFAVCMFYFAADFPRASWLVLMVTYLTVLARTFSLLWGAKIVPFPYTNIHYCDVSQFTVEAAVSEHPDGN